MLLYSQLRALKPVVTGSRKGPRRRPARKVRLQNRLSVEALEERFLLSASNTLTILIPAPPTIEANQGTAPVQSTVVEATTSEKMLEPYSEWGPLAWNKRKAIQTDGKVVTLGGADYGFVLWRNNSDGSLDTNFGQGGLVISWVGTYNFARAIAFQTDGKIIVLCESDGPSFA